jgi:hypothetical protein
VTKCGARASPLGFERDAAQLRSWAHRSNGRGADRVDATSRVGGRFVEHDSTEENLQTLRGWLERYGRPLALYTDKNSLSVTTRAQQWAKQLQDTPARTQFGRALAELDVGWIAAHSPQAKGRIERLFGTLQNRLLKEMRLAQNPHAGTGQSFFGNHFLAILEPALPCTARAERQRAPPCRGHPAPGANSQRTGGAHGRFGPHGQMEGKTLGSAA